MTYWSQDTSTKEKRESVRQVVVQNDFGLTKEEILFFCQASQDEKFVIPDCFHLVVPPPPSVVPSPPKKNFSLKTSIEQTVSLIGSSPPSSLKSGKGVSLLSPLPSSFPPSGTPEEKEDRDVEMEGTPEFSEPPHDAQFLLPGGTQEKERTGWDTEEEDLYKDNKYDEPPITNYNYD